jgi:hypothetical protein
MRAPMPDPDTDQLATAIVDEYGRACLDQNACLVSKMAEAEIRASFIILRAIRGNEPALGYPADNKKHAEKLGKSLAQLEQVFTDLPKSFLRHMFYRADLAEATTELNLFLDAVGALRERCAVILESEQDGNRNTDLDKRQAAMAARYFTERCGLPLTYSTETSVYRVAAPLFYEAMTMTGWTGPNLKQQCEDVARMPVSNWKDWQTKFGEMIVRVLRRPRLQMDDKDGPPEEEDRFIGNT